MKWSGGDIIFPMQFYFPNGPRYASSTRYASSIINHLFGSDLDFYPFFASFSVLFEQLYQMLPARYFIKPKVFGIVFWLSSEVTNLATLRMDFVFKNWPKSNTVKVWLDSDGINLFWCSLFKL